MRPLRLLVPLLLTAMLTPLAAAGGASASTRPTLAVEETTAQGAETLVAVDPRAAKRCSLVTISPGGRQQTHKLRGGRPYGVLIRIRPQAPIGEWDLSVRCGKRSSAPARVNVSGTARGRGTALVRSTHIRPYRTTPPADFGGEHPDQDATAAPALDFDPTVLDGLGGGEGERGRAAIEWALSKIGDPSYHMWCLRFTANAYGAALAGFYSAQTAANALRPRDAAKGVAGAPAGALVFFKWSDPRTGESLGHVGISLGDGRMVHASKTVRAEAPDAYWRSRYLGWASPPASWPGRPPMSPPTETAPPTTAPTTPPTTTPTPPSTPTNPTPAQRRVIAVDNRVTNGMGMREDPTPARLTTKPWRSCSSRGCNINGTERSSGGTYDAAVCQTTGERVTNGNDSSAADDGNPQRFESTRFYGVRLGDGTFGYVSEVWIRAADRGGLGLPAC